MIIKELLTEKKLSRAIFNALSSPVALGSKSVCELVPKIDIWASMPRYLF